MLFWMVLIGVVLSLPIRAEALAPKLMWQKKMNFNETNLGFAKDTGDVAVAMYGRGIIFFDKDGNVRSQVAPKVNRVIYHVRITADGKYYDYTSSWKLEVINKMRKKNNEVRLHYVQKNGKELWSRPLPFDPNTDINNTSQEISPDNKYVAYVGSEEEGGDVELWDIMSQKKLWLHKCPGSSSFEFSPDSKYIVVDWGGIVELIDLAGNVLFKVDSGTFITSVANDANYIATSEGTSDTGVRLLDKKGGIVLQGGPDDITFVSENGNRGVLWDKEGIKIYSLPDKTLLGIYPIRSEKRAIYLRPLVFSMNERYLVAAGNNMTAKSDNNLFVLDLTEKKMWQTMIPNLTTWQIHFTSDGRYLLITGGGKLDTMTNSMLYYYQIY